MMIKFSSTQILKPFFATVSLFFLSITLLAGCDDGSGDNDSAVDRLVTLQWEAPTTYVDGECVAELSGYKINYGRTPGYYPNSIDVSADAISCGPSGNYSDTPACGEIPLCSASVYESNFGSDTWYITIQAIDTQGGLSDYSNEVVGTFG